MSNNIKSEVVSSFERNGKMYIVLEVDNLGDVEKDTERFFDLPDWNDFNVDLSLEGNKICFAFYYKGEEKWKQCIEFMPEGCFKPGDITLFDIGPAEIYLRAISVCPIDSGKINVSFQVWAKAGPLKTKLASIDKNLP